jgi:HSP20 family protein
MRSFQLPQGLDESKIEADYNNGILSIHIPKTALPQPRKIQIGSSKQGQVSNGPGKQGQVTSGTNKQAQSNGQTEKNGRSTKSESSRQSEMASR